EKINELTLTAVREDTTLEISPRVFTREYRITYRNHLTEAEKTMEGSWGENPNANSDLVPVSLEDRYAERMKVKIGDTLVFNVQGAPIATQVSHLRQVDWNRVQSNFLVVFPEGVLEQAPQFHVLMTRSDDEQQAARFQRK